MPKRSSQEIRDTIVSDYLGGLTMAQAAAKHGATTKLAKNALHEAGVSPRPPNRGSARRIAVDECFFDSINSPEKAYWAGFITADGTVRHNRVILALSGQDAEHVQGFADAISSKHIVKTRIANAGNGKGYRVARIDVTSMKLASSIARLGIEPRKTHTVKPLELQDGDLQTSYWRGVFDGDGYVTKSGRGWCVGLVGNEFIVDGFRSFVEAQTGTAMARKLHSRIFICRTGGIDPPKTVASLLLQHRGYCLKRKSDLLQNVMETQRVLIDRSAVTATCLSDLHAELGTWGRVAKHLRTSDGGLWHLRKRCGLLP